MGARGIFERKTERAAVVRLISEMRMGRGGALFVVGEGGLGKTTILNQARELASPDVRIGWGRGDVMEESLPFGLFAEVLATVDGPRSLLDPSMNGSRNGDFHADRFGAVLRWLQSTATEPVLLILDDLHWADPDSLTLVSYLARRIKRMPVAMLAALRPWPPAAYELSAALSYDGEAAVARLASLSPDAGVELLAARLGGPVSEGLSRKALELCGGNPLLLEQVAAAIGRGDSVVAPTRTGTASNERMLVLARFAGVPKAAIRCAQAASVLGTRFRPELAITMAQLDDRESYMALDALCRSGLVRSGPEMAEFVHPLLCHALYDDLAVPVRARLHARAFTALSTQGLDDEAVDHAIRADLTGNDLAIRTMTRAGLAALRSGAFTMATHHLQAAVRIAGSRADTDLLLALAESLLVAGHPSEAIVVCNRLRFEQELTSAQQIQTSRILGSAFLTTGGHHDSATCFAEAADLAEKHDPVVAIDVLLDAALLRCTSVGPVDALPLAERACTLASDAEQSLSNRAASVWGYLALISGDPQGLMAGEAETLASLRDLRWSWRILKAFCVSAVLTERFNDAQHVLDVIVPAAERIGAVDALNELAMAQAVVAARQGRLAEALDGVERVSSLIDSVPEYGSHADFIRVELLHHMGRAAESMEWCDRIEPDATARGESYTLLRLWNVRGQHLLRGEKPEAASDLYIQIEELGSRMGIGEPCWIPWARYAVTAHLSACRNTDARRVIAWLDRSAARLPCRYPQIAATTGRASLAEAEGDHEAAEAYYSSALALHGQVALPLEQVETLLAYGSFLRRRGHARRARPLLAQAAAIAEAHQAGWLGEQVREELAAAGGRRRRKETTRLTIQEQRVARLAAAGHSNKTIAAKLTLSVKTIEYHLQQIYKKLRITSRRQLMTGQHEYLTASGISGE